jgi:hypothetical protein
MVEEIEEFYVPQEEPETIEHLDAEMSASEGTYNGCRQGKMPTTKFQSSDGHSFHVERDFAKQYVTFETSEHLEAEMSALECTYNGCRQGKMPSTKFQSSDGHIFRVERYFAKQHVTFMFDEEEEPVTNGTTRRTKKAAKRARQRSAKYGTAAVEEVGDWRLECTYDGCTAGEGGAKFKTPALSPAQALAYLGLHREAAHGQHGAAAGVGAESFHLSKIPTPEAQQVLAPKAKQVLAPEAQQVLTPAAKQVLAPAAKQVLAPEAKQVPSQEAKHASEKTTAGTDHFTTNTMKLSEKSGNISKVSQSIQNMMKKQQNMKKLSHEVWDKTEGR